MELLLKFLLLQFLFINGLWSFRCDRRPYGTTSQSSAPDGRFKLEVLGIDNAYIPEQLYTIQITETDGESQFVGFMISAEGDVKPAPGNPRRMVSQYPGDIRPQDQVTARFSDRCVYSVEHVSSLPKSSVQVYWQAPPSGNGCVTLRAMVAENEDAWFEDGSPLTQRICEDTRQPDDMSPQLNYDCQVYWQAPPSGNGCVTLRAMVAENEDAWFEDGSPLTQRICEDTRQPDDMSPQLNYDCQACDEAKYEVRFTGMWSRNIHPQLYPENDWIPRYSDLVGASHAADYILWAPGNLVTDGFKDLAEHGNSSKLEAEIMEKIGDGVRTLIKGKGHGYRKMSNPTYAIFRTDKIHHLVTVAIGLFPSPDWFLGVTKFELCQQDNTWLKERELDLFPWDAGTDSGVSYESPNIETYPRDAVTRVQMSSYDKNSPFYEVDMKDLHPFGSLHIKLIRTYHRECEEPSEVDENAPTEDNKEEPKKEDEPEPSSEAPVKQDPESTKECPLTEWTEFSPCEGECHNGKMTGYKWRERYHMVNGIGTDAGSNNWRKFTKAPPANCISQYEYFQHVECEEDCSVDDGDNSEHGDDVTVERRVSSIVPGSPWSKKRELPLPKYKRV